MVRHIHVENRQSVRDLRSLIQGRFGEEAATAFLEAIGNVRDHCADKRCKVSVTQKGWSLTDRGTGIETTQTSKPQAFEDFAEGGYGLQMIVILGGRIVSSPSGTTVYWGIPRKATTALSAEIALAA
jgi:hypothetical protein